MGNWTWDKKRLLVESVIAIACAFIGIMFGKASNTYYYNGQKISETELNTIMAENAEFKSLYETATKDNEILTVKMESLSKDNENYKKTNNELTKENATMKKQLDMIPAMEYKDLGLMVSGEEQAINKRNAFVVIDGTQYFSKDFIDVLVGQDKSATIKDGMMYIGKIIAEQAQLSKQWVITKSGVGVGMNVVDSYGNGYTDAFLFRDSENNIKIKLDKKYSMLKAKVAVKEKMSASAKGYLEIFADDVSVCQPIELTLMTQVSDIDIPINNANVLTIKYTSSSSNIDCIVADAIVYN